MVRYEKEICGRGIGDVQWLLDVLRSIFRCFAGNGL